MMRMTVVRRLIVTSRGLSAGSPARWISCRRAHDRVHDRVRVMFAAAFHRPPSVDRTELWVGRGVRPEQK